MSGFKLNFESQFDILNAIFCFNFSLHWCCSWHTMKKKGNDQDLTKYLINDCSSFWIMRVSLWSPNKGEFGPPCPQYSKPWSPQYSKPSYAYEDCASWSGRVLTHSSKRMERIYLLKGTKTAYTSGTTQRSMRKSLLG